MRARRYRNRIPRPSLPPLPRGWRPYRPRWAPVRVFDLAPPGYRRPLHWRHRVNFHSPVARRARNRLRAQALRAIANRTAPGIASLVAGFLGPTL